MWPTSRRANPGGGPRCRKLALTWRDPIGSQEAAADSTNQEDQSPVNRRHLLRAPAASIGVAPVHLPPPAPLTAPGELREDPLSGRLAAIAAGRAARPEAFLRDVGPSRGTLGCPFCPGHEHMTPPEVWADREPGSAADSPGWKVRVVPNKFPAFAGPPAAPNPDGGLYRSAPSAGAHEVVIHSTDHDASIADLEAGQTALVMSAYLERLAGPDCAACAVVKRERGGDRAVEEAGELLTICPWASSMPYESLLVPAAHLPRFEEGDTDGDLRIAGAIGRLLRRFGGVVGASAPYNLVLHSAPPGVSDFHWHLHLLPRLTTYGGFELATGIIINVVDPDQAAAGLRAASPEPSRAPSPGA